MGHCLTHNQSYSEQMGGYCPYCGSPQDNIEIRTTSGTDDPFEKFYTSKELTEYYSNAKFFDVKNEKFD